MKIQAAIFREPGVPFSVEGVDLAEPRKGEVLVKIKAAGVCHSDWHLMTGATPHPVPAVPGHEGAGVVEQVGDGVSSVSSGDHVALSWAPNCGECFYCRKGRPSLCGTYVGPIWAGTMLDGTTRLSQGGSPIFHFSALACFAEYAVVPEVCCVKMRPDIPLEIVALIGCAVTTGVGAALNTVKIEPGSSVAIVGVGGVGLSAVMGAKIAGADPIVAVDISGERLSKAAELGAKHLIEASSDVEQGVRGVTSGRGADYVIEAAGLVSTQELSYRLARPGGTVVFAGLSPVGSATNLPGADIVRQEKTIQGSYYGTAHPARDFGTYGDWFVEGKLPVDKLLGNRYRLDQINEAYAEMLKGATSRGVIVFD